MGRPRRRKRQATLPSRNLWLALPAAVGLVLSGYMLVARAAHAPLYCPVGTGCDIVQSSRFAAVFGFPVAGLGVVFYATVLALGLRRLPPATRWRLALPVASAGVAASVVFTAVQQSAIRATCSLCLLSAALSVVILVRVAWPARQVALSRFHAAPTWWWSTGAVAATLIFLISGYAASAPRSGPADFTEELAGHLTATGAVFYGAYWCPHCEDQKALFGRAARLLPYVECDPRSPAGRPQVCREKGIRVFPTWDIGNQRFEGVLSLDDLARLSGFRSSSSGP